MKTIDPMTETFRTELEKFIRRCDAILEQRAHAEKLLAATSNGTPTPKPAKKAKKKRKNRRGGNIPGTRGWKGRIRECLEDFRGTFLTTREIADLIDAPMRLVSPALSVGAADHTWARTIDEHGKYRWGIRKKDEGNGDNA